MWISQLICGSKRTPIYLWWSTHGNGWRWNPRFGFTYLKPHCARLTYIQLLVIQEDNEDRSSLNNLLTFSLDEPQHIKHVSPAPWCKLWCCNASKSSLLMISNQLFQNHSHYRYNRYWVKINWITFMNWCHITIPPCTWNQTSNKRLIEDQSQWFSYLTIQSLKRKQRHHQNLTLILNHIEHWHQDSELSLTFL